MDRIFLIQFLIDKKKYKNYLEIGTYKGKSFFPIKCKNKIAVDPLFRFSQKEKWRWILKNPFNINNRYFEMTSDNFFKSGKLQAKVDIALIDGLHTFEATLKDVLHTLEHLNPQGTIVCHDCFPPHKGASLYAEDISQARSMGKNMQGWTGEWCGDTWKTMAYLKRRYPQELNIKVFNTDYGLGVIQKSGNAPLNLIIEKKVFEEVNKLTYEELVQRPSEMINLVEEDCYKSL